MSKMKIAIWGSYNYGNYGDDLMAIQFAQHIKNLGADPYVFRLNSDLAKKYSINVANTWEELFDDAKLCFIGGGGVLIDVVKTSVDQEFELLHSMSLKYRCPVFPISIGGEGKTLGLNMSERRRNFFKGDACQFSTVRLKHDVELLESFGKVATYYPDVLLSVKKFWDIKPIERVDENVHIGINLPDSKQGRLLAWQLKIISSLRKGIVFHFIPTYLPGYSGHIEMLPKKETCFFRKHVYQDPKSTLEFIASLDLVVSYKLHLGLTALALGVPFFSVGGPGKAKAFLKEIDAEFAIFPSSAKRFKLAKILLDRQKVQDVKGMFDFSLIDDLSKLSIGHMNQITKIILEASNYEV